MAAVGAAIGLGNFWRFPYLTAKHGGAWFFLPWLTCLAVIGIPFMILEIGLGQKFQKGPYEVFRRLDKNLLCVGSIIVYSCAIYPMYYNVTVSWALIYLVVGFASPLPWASGNQAFVDKCSGAVSRAE